MRGKFNLILILVDLIVLSAVLIMEIGLKEERLIKVLFFSLTVRVILLTIILITGYIIRKLIFKTPIQGFLTTALVGYFILITVYLNENGFSHWEKTLISIHTSWKSFGQILFPYCIALIVVYLIGRKNQWQ